MQSNPAWIETNLAKIGADLEKIGDALRKIGEAEGGLGAKARRIDRSLVRRWRGNEGALSEWGYEVSVGTAAAPKRKPKA